MNSLQYYFFQGRLVTSLKQLISGLTADHNICQWCAEQGRCAVIYGPHHPECRVGKAMILLKEIEEAS